MRILKHTKKLAALLSLSLFTAQALPLNGWPETAVSAQTAFQNVHELYSYWCQNEDAYPDNVGEVYCYYYDTYDAMDFEDIIIPADGVAAEDSDATEEKTVGAADAEDSGVTEGKTVGDAAADQEDYAYVIGLVNDTEEEEEKILSQLEDKSHVKFTSCDYSHKELMAAFTEINDSMLAAENKEDVDKTYLGICGAGITCSNVTEDGNGGFTPMKCYVDVLVLEEYYDDTSKLLAQKYGDKVQVSAGAVTTVEDVEDTVMIDDTAMTDGIDEAAATDEFDIGGLGTVMDAAATVEEIAEEEVETAAKSGFLRTTTALTVGDTFTFACSSNGKKTVKWSVTPSKKVSKLSTKDDSKLKIKAKKTGFVTITAKTAGKKKITQKVLILDKKGTVSNQKQLTAALNSDKVKKITIKTSVRKNFTIPAGSGVTKKIIVNAPKSDLSVEEPSLIASITIEKIKQFNPANGDDASKTVSAADAADNQAEGGAEDRKEISTDADRSA
jgi:hypothetical protein